MTMQKFNTVLFLMVSFALVRCGENTPGSQGPGVSNQGFSLNGLEYMMLDKGTLEATDLSLSGTGSIIFKEARSDEDNSYTLGFSLKDKGQVVLITNANSKLAGGANLAFARDGSQLVVTLTVGSESYDISSDFSSIDAAGALNFTVEVHGHGHVVTQVGADKLEYSFTTKIPGRLWGLSIKDATITKAVAGKATEEG